jgi:cation diffusion facilitator family transporter
MKKIVRINPDNGAWLSIIIYLLLSTIKLIISDVANSKALQADGLNNLTDIITSVAVLIGLKISRKPRDRDHPYGHSRAETIASLFSAFIMMTIGIEVLINATYSIWKKDIVTPNIIAAWASLFSAVILFTVSGINKKLAEKSNSHALKAVSKDNFSDALVSTGAVIGIFASQYQLPWLDSATAFIVAGIICNTAWGIFKESSHMLTDGFDEDKLQRYKYLIEKISGVISVKDVQARMNGSAIIIDVTIKVKPDLNVVKSHQIADQIEEQLTDMYDIKEIHVHVEPDLH